MIDLTFGSNVLGRNPKRSGSTDENSALLNREWALNRKRKTHWSAGTGPSVSGEVRTRTGLYIPAQLIYAEPGATNETGLSLKSADRKP